jgi:hypothetical protein
LLQVALNSRINSGNSLISRGGTKIKGFINSIDLPATSVSSTNSNSSLKVGLLLGVLFLSGYIFYKKYTKKQL